jgi:hypothetical protein
MAVDNLPSVTEEAVERAPVLEKAARLPYALLGLLFAGLAWFVAAGYRDHGRTFDEWMQDDYGQRTLLWYLSFGKDRSFMEIAPQIHMPEHGPAYEVFVAAIQRMTGELWDTRSLINGIVGVLGIFFVAMCGRELAGPWGAFTAAAGLALYPRYTGAMFANSKDVPFTVAMILVLWLTLRMMRRWDDHGRRFEVLDYALLGAAIGAAAAVRVNALAWFALLGLLAVGYWVRHRAKLATGRAVREELAAMTGAALVIGSTCYLVMSLLWPFLILNPTTGLLDAIKMMAKYDWNNTVLFGGERVLATDLPLSYAPTWLFIGSPLPLVCGVIAAFFVFCWMLVRRVRVPAGYLLVAGSFVLPLVLIMGLHATLYNGLRQFLYIVPGMVLLATGLLVAAVRKLREAGLQWVAWGLIGLAVLGQGEAAYASAKIYPYEYAYFNPLVGGYSAAHLEFEGDYWGSCSTEAARWLAANYQNYYSSANMADLTFQDEVNWNTLSEPYLPGFTAVGDGHPIYLLSWEPQEGYKEIHTIVVGGYPLCYVSIQEGLVAG